MCTENRAEGLATDGNTMDGDNRRKQQAMEKDIIHPSLSLAEGTRGVMRRRASPTNNANGGGSSEKGTRKGKNLDPRDDKIAPTTEQPPPKVSYSSGVAFYPPSDKYWRIGGKWYDFADFLPRHPGGAEILIMARDRFEDCTFVFESHHHDYKRARAMIRRYEVPESAVRAAGGLRRRPACAGRTGGGGAVGHRDRHLDAGETPRLLPDDAFYSILRRRVAAHLKNAGYPDGAPTMQCIVLFWISFFSWLTCALWLYSSCSVLAAVCAGFAGAWLGAFGHNWVHQPKYKFWAYLSLDTIGLCSDMWFRDHNLQHHMYTNTPWDNHFEGTAPFLVTDPTVERNWLQRRVMPYINPILLSFGPFMNYMAHVVELIKGNERVTPWKLLYPLEIAAMAYRWGWRGLLLCYLSQSILGVYYFTLALMNHNAEACMDVKKRNTARDWGEAQLVSSADWGVGTPFWAAGVYLWLNYHTVHHLFPRVDMSHHVEIQKIMLRTCEEFGIDYVVKTPVEIYVQMVRMFSSPKSLMQEILVYGGGI